MYGKITNMERNLFKEKAYKLLMEHYRTLYNKILYRAQNVNEHGNGDDAKKFVSSIVEKDKYDYCGLQDRCDTEVVKMLEYLLDDGKEVSKWFR